MKLRAKFTIAYMGIILALGAAVVLFITLSYSQKLTAQLQEKGFTIARDLNIRCVDDILVDDMVSVQKSISNIVTVEEDVYYAFIANSQGEVLAHTFENGLPKWLLTANPSDSNHRESIRLLDTEVGLIRDIAVPIMDGSLGMLHVGVSDSHIKKAVTSSVRRLFAIIGITLITGIVGTHLLVGRIVKPISEMTKAARLVGEGTLDTQVKVDSKDEIGKLADTFNLMAVELKRAQEDLVDAQEQLDQTRRLASVGNFASGIAHEINNPLGGVMNCTRTLLNSPEIKGEKRQYLELILKGLIRIESVIKQLLAFSIQRSIEPRLVRIEEVVGETLDFMEGRMREQKVKVEKKFPLSLPEIMADHSQLQQVFMNVIKNALDAMPNGGKLNIKAATRNSDVMIEFADTGCGIKKEDIPRIFEPFFTTKAIGKGVGLGLSVSYGIIQQHDGIMRVRSKQAEGTTVTILLPIKRGANGRKEDIDSRG